MSALAPGTAFRSPPVDPMAAAAGSNFGLPQPNIAALSLPTLGISSSAAAGATPSRLTLDYGTQYFLSKGFTPAQAQGMTQGLLDESGGIPNAFNPAGGNLGAYGLAQDRGERQRQMIQLYGPTPTVPQQLDFALRELNTTEKGALAAIKAATTPEEARAAMSAKFERPGGSSYEQQKSSVLQQQGDLTKKIQALSDKIGSLDARDPESLKALAGYRQKMEAYQEQALQTAMRPPSAQPRDEMQRMGGMATVLGMMFGLMTKRPLIASLKAGAAAMDAYNKQDDAAYKVHLDRWKTQLDAMFQMAEFEHQMYTDTLRDEKLSEGEKLDKLKMQANLLHNENMILAAESGNLDNAQRTQFLNENILLKWQQANKPQLYLDPKTGRPLEYRPLSGETTESSLPEHATKIGSVGTSGGEWSKDAIDALVTQALTVGSQNIITSLPRGGPARKQFEEGLAERLKEQEGGIAGGTAKMVMNQLRMVEAKSAATTAGRLTMNTHAFTTEAIGAGKLVVEAARAVPRAIDIPAVNKIEQAYLTQTGDPSIIRLGGAINNLLNVYGKMSNPTGTGIHDADKARLEIILSAALSQRQIEGAVDQIIKEGANLSQAAEQAQREVLQSIVPPTPGAPAPAAPTTTAATQTPTNVPTKPPIIQNGWRYDPDTHQPLGPVTQ